VRTAGPGRAIIFENIGRRIDELDNLEIDPAQNPLEQIAQV